MVNVQFKNLNFIRRFFNYIINICFISITIVIVMVQIADLNDLCFNFRLIYLTMMIENYILYDLENLFFFLNLINAFFFLKKQK